MVRVRVKVYCLGCRVMVLGFWLGLEDLLSIGVTQFMQYRVWSPDLQTL